jgi:hypothetical protein
VEHVALKGMSMNEAKGSSFFLFASVTAFLYVKAVAKLAAKFSSSTMRSSVKPRVSK